MEYSGKQCKHCGGQIPVKRPRDRAKEFCGRACVSRHLFQKARPLCPICSKPVGLPTRTYCSLDCAGQGKIKEHWRVCEYCKKKFKLQNIAYERRGKGRFCSTECSQRSGKKYHCDESFFEKINTEAKSYWLGFLMADGYNGDSEVVINLKASDASHLVKFLHSIKATNLVTYKQEADVASIRISSRKLCNDLTDLGCIRAKSLVLDFPVGKIPMRLMPHFVRGYFDGDGCVHISKKGHKRITFYSGSIKFIDGLARFLNESGLQVFTRHKDRRFLNISNRSGVQSMRKFLYARATIYLDRKKAKFDSSQSCNIERSLVLW